MRISDWSSDVCSSDLLHQAQDALQHHRLAGAGPADHDKRFARIDAEVDSIQHGLAAKALDRSAERRVGKECVSTCRSRWSPSHQKKNYQYTYITTQSIYQTIHLTVLTKNLTT